MASSSGSSGTSQRLNICTPLFRPMLIGKDEPEDEKAHELALETFYLEENEYDDLHRHWYRTSKKDRELMKSSGLVWKTGRWSVHEIKVLKRNVKAFMKEHGIKDIATFVLYTGKHRTKGRQFYTFIGKGIQRPLFSIYRKVILVFNVQNYVGRWTPEMNEELHRLHKIYGNKWATIGKHMGISGRAVSDHFRKVTNRKNVGLWSEAEEQRLQEAMAEIQRDNGGEHDDLPNSVRWEDVAAKVETRNAVQCLNKWILTLSWKQTPQGKIKWTNLDNLKLIRVLSSLEDVEDEEEVDWQELCRDWPAAHNVRCLRVRWAALRRDVPHYHVQTMQENLEYLMTNKVPTLVKHCQE